MSEEKPILSFTSTKARIPLIDPIFKAHLSIADACGMRVVFSCQSDSLNYLTKYQKTLIETGRIELLQVEKDDGANTKWTLCRKAHPNAIMVVVDDDWIYDIEGIRSLLETHIRFPNAVICRAYRTIPWVGSELPLYKVKPFYTYPKTVTPHINVNRAKDNIGTKDLVLTSGQAYPLHYLGVLYPPCFPSSNSDDIPSESRKNDDVYIGAKIAEEGCNLVFAGRSRISNDKNIHLPSALWSASCQVNGMDTFLALKSIKSKLTSKGVPSPLGKVFLLTCKKYPNRRQSIKEELRRLGIGFIEQYDDGSSYPLIGFKHKHVNRCHLAKYLALKRFLESPSERMTIIEDDVRFHKKVSLVADALNSIPKGFGACRLSWSPSPYIRKEMKATRPTEVIAIDRAMSRPGAYWAKCPWASTDGCTVITREVAERFYIRLKQRIEEGDTGRIDNSDDMLCRICENMRMPMYVYKPLMCIQIQMFGEERGKSPTAKFLKGEKYHVPGVVLSPDCYEIPKQNDPPTPPVILEQKKTSPVHVFRPQMRRIQMRRQRIVPYHPESPDLTMHSIK